MVWYENIGDAITLGGGFVMYKYIMSELAKEPVKEGVKVTSEGLLGFKGLTPIELGKAITGTEAGQFGGGGFQPRDPAWIGGFGLTGTPTVPFSETFEDWSIMYGSLLPEGFELVGPSRTGITRPKGLD